jgi:uncharacterized 2Fe-2S/4Fe-4S cluster protein (DUF4445 family)
MKDTEVLIPHLRSGDEDFSILVDYNTDTGLPTDDDAHTPGSDVGGVPASAKANTVRNAYAIAIDIGTTTVVAKLIELSTGLELASTAQLNAQRPYGADVISRIDASLDDSTPLSRLISSQIDNMITTMLDEQNVASDQVHKLVIAANTTMSYILLGLPCRSLGSAPFTPAFTIRSPYPYHEIFHTNNLDCACDVLPFISAYVGGDLTAGLCALRGEEDFILMDMGTNGELIFKRGDRLICTATAAGPAFEGGAIECGSGSTAGAISSVWYEDGVFGYKTIGAAPPTGICGSGILDLMAVLIREGMVDETGYLSDSIEGGRVVLAPGSESDKTPAVYFTQKDVRHYQLAKSAVRTGLQILLKEMGSPAPEKVFLAGGFGQNLNPESAQATGLLPEEFKGRVVPIGNSSLSGAVKVCLNNSVRGDIVTQIAKGQEINLATHPLFNELFMENMSFA